MNKFKIILSHAGKQHSYQVARAMESLGVLKGFYTSSYIRSRYVQSVIQRSNNTLLSRRFIEGLSGAKIHPNWRFEWKELVYARLFGIGKKTQQAVYTRDEKFDNYMSKKIQQLQGDVFWGFQGSSHNSLIQAKQKGKLAILELTTAHVVAAKKILGEERSLHPEWSDSFNNIEFPPEYEKRLEEEPHLADYVVAASSFTKQTLLDVGIKEDKIKILPLGVDFRHVVYSSDKKKEFKNPLKLLYAGRITQGKGIKYLLEAMRQFNPKEVELHITGHMQGTGDGLKPYKGLYHLHTPLSQQELFKEYKNYDALVLPSIFEGFGLVIIEAMAAGLPVIATNHTMAPDIIDHQIDGFVIPIRDVNAIVKSIEYLRDLSDEKREQMSELAREKANKYTWDAYTDRLNIVLQSLMLN